jgi:hypothetical protein
MTVDLHARPHSFPRDLTSWVVAGTNTFVLGRLLWNWYVAWPYLSRGHSWLTFLVAFRLVDWFFLLVPLAGLVLELTRSRWSGLVNVVGHFSVFLWLSLVLFLATHGLLGFSGPEHVLLALILRGLPALAIAVTFAWLFHRAHRLSPSLKTAGRA